MLHLTRKSGKMTDTCIVDAMDFYNDELEPMISDPAPYGSRKWTGAQRLFFNIPNPETTSPENMMKSQSQMRDFFRYFRPTYNEYIGFIRNEKHPLVEMANYPGTYNKQICEYLFELSDNTEQELQYYLRNQCISYIEGDTKRVDGRDDSSPTAVTTESTQSTIDRRPPCSGKGKSVARGEWVADEGLVGKRVEVYWGANDKWYTGKVVNYTLKLRDREGCSGLHYVIYDDDDHGWYNLNKMGCHVIDGETRTPVVHNPEMVVSPEICPSWARNWG